MILTLALAFTPQSRAAGKGASSSPSSGGGNFRIMIPVRFNVFVGYHASSNSFDADKKDFALNRTGFGADFNVPIPAINGLIGLNGWLVPQASTGNGNHFFLVGPYIGYAGERNDFFLGVAMAQLRDSTTGDSTNAYRQTDLNITMGCGTMGYRVYFGKGITAGLGLQGYYCKASTYDKDRTTTSGSFDHSTVEAGAYSAGGILSFMISWNEERQLR